ncbi:mitochondrial ribosomal protein subunit L20-domain-containing protein [Podospora appendiculata]|uniref:Mitochondrial ribosomal protein subunit L20-domain-containing protein n=1 Tax=Podospora appendiculata TaxID=314037 RepID=A0AAE0X681_9PEZI|nr:mitochondrial ribosomal protein subunit L20-domain-containing protein [Podospora appendiculata]
MEARLLRRPAATCCHRLLASSTTPAASLLPPVTLQFPSTGARHKSTTNRTKRALNIAPHASFLNKPSATDRIIFNPPSSAASVFHTPFKFLPKTDPRRRANLTSLFASSASIQFNSPSSSASDAAPAPGTTEDTLPPKIGGRVGRTHHMTKEDVLEMRRLRETDPVANSVNRLAAKFGCSHLFVLMCCQAPREHKEKHVAAGELVKSRWGPRRRAAREDRKRRLEMLFRGEL